VYSLFVLFLFVLLFHLLDSIVIPILVEIALLLEFEDGLMKVLSEHSEELLVSVSVAD
jgi:hypothetical protein